MNYGLLFLFLGTVLGLQAALLRGFYGLLLWPGLSCFLVGLAYLGHVPRVFGKRSRGTMAWYSVLVLLPYLLVNWFVWRLLRQFSKEDCFNEVIPGLYIGRRPLRGEVPADVTMIVDLTAEFPEPHGIRNGREYIASPILDGGTPAELPFKTLVDRIAIYDGPVYIHCAQGHGRTGMVAAAVLVSKGHCRTISEALSHLRLVRPRLNLRREQSAFIERICTITDELRARHPR